MSSRGGGILANTVNALSALRFTNARDPQLSKLDFGILKVALMVAALDGEVLPEEVQAFCTLAKKCRGYGEKAFRNVRESAFRSAGYIALLARHGSREELLKAFADEAVVTLPEGFAYGKLVDVRRAFVMWIAMGISDGSFSAIEREAIEALRRALAEIKRSRSAADFERWVALSPAFRQAAGTTPRPAKIMLVSEEFMAKAESLVKKQDEAGLNTLIIGE